MLIRIFSIINLIIYIIDLNINVSNLINYRGWNILSSMFSFVLFQKKQIACLD